MLQPTSPRASSTGGSKPTSPRDSSTGGSKLSPRPTTVTPQPSKIVPYGELPTEHGKVTKIALTKLAIYCEDGTLYVVKNTKGVYEFKIVPHPAGIRGYQRKPTRRLPWLKKRAMAFDPERFKSLDVVLRDDGYYYVVDGGGRTLMAMLLGIDHVYAKVHTTTEITEEASLFRDFANEVVRLGSVDDWRAAYAEGNPKAIDMFDSMQPYYGIGSGKENIHSVGAIACLHDSKWGGGSKLLNKTCMLIRNTVGPNKSKKRLGFTIPGNYAVAVGAFLEVGKNVGGYDEAKLRRVLEQLPPLVLINAARGDAGLKAKTNDWPYFMLSVIATKYNNKLSDNYSRISKKDVNSSSLLEAFSKKQYSGYQHERFDAGKKV